jgi:hypothetical protein
LSNNPDVNHYAQRAEEELEAASRKQTREEKREHLDRAAIYAALDEAARGQGQGKSPGDVG